MSVKELKSVDISSYTIISTGIVALICLLISLIIAGTVSLMVPNSFGVMIYTVPTIVFSGIICSIFLHFSGAYLYNILSKRIGCIKFNIEGDYIEKISTKETALLVGTITLIILLVVYLAFSLLIPLFLSSLITVLMYASQTAVASIIYQAMIVISNPTSIIFGIVAVVIFTSVFTLLGTYIYNLLGSSERGISVKLENEGDLVQLESINPLDFGIAIGAICLILSFIIGLIMILSGTAVFSALSSILGTFVSSFIGAVLIAFCYNFLAPKIGKLKVELE
ncbi:MAG: hypothetical protein IJQ68_05755 [Methanobrevibacter sp.]|uniref:hypothetical protein n=1 Tax=Methanobrevibacter sp. TaxID=66852 RepID=UPI0025F4EC02|nr:hypothetical protein [Methanobrevibacter sp.]MBR0271477.1 hypothetical protein [Methanobrevibacter sp.]